MTNPDNTTTSPCTCGLYQGCDVCGKYRRDRLSARLMACPKNPRLAALHTAAHAVGKSGETFAWGLSDGAEVLRVEKTIHIAEPDGTVHTVHIDDENITVKEFVTRIRAARTTASG